MTQTLAQYQLQQALLDCLGIPATTTPRKLPLVKGGTKGHKPAADSPWLHPVEVPPKGAPMQ